MGCDIHLYREKRVNGQWLTADEWEDYDYGDDDKGSEVPWDKRFTDRNYQLFGLLSDGVRSSHPFSFEPRGIPFNACAEIAAKSEQWGMDGHGHSYLYLHELKEMRAYLDVATIEISGMIESGQLAELRATIDAGAPNWELLFPYCASTNAPGHVNFSIDVPASFYMGHGLSKIIDSFDSVDGDNHRVVFFFDN